MKYWSVGVLNRLINMRVPFAFSITSLPYFFITPLLQHSIIPYFHYSNTSFFFHYSNTPILHYSIFYIPNTWHINVMTAVATIILTMLVTTAEVAAYPTADALLSHCIPRRHPERATKIPKTAL
jgi:hypothetical protein